ncbi:MAG TPA: c-type cytochrome [Vicinamibacterales bacterium]|jgi:thiosulfate dehydrogenase
MQRGARAGIGLIVFAAAACARSTNPTNPPAPLVPSTSTMVTAWDVPQNPLTDRSLDSSPMGKQVRWGYEIFVDTANKAPRFARAKVACANCHLNAGQRERALPIVGVAGMFPEPNARAGRLISLPDRIVDCFNRSENGAAREAADLPTPASNEVLAVVAYITWLSRGFRVGENPAFRARNTLPAASLVPIDAIDPAAGASIYSTQCASCHGTDGQGVQIGDKKAGPLWGPDSWNDGAGAARTYTLAGIIRYSMPYLNPGSLSDAEAQQVAAFITSKPRPSYPFKQRDYPSSKIPPDAVYYNRP